MTTCFRFNQQSGPTAIDVHDKLITKRNIIGTSASTLHLLSTLT